MNDQDTYISTHLPAMDARGGGGRVIKVMRAPFVCCGFRVRRITWLLTMNIRQGEGTRDETKNKCSYLQ